jgi:hypothetical protein
MSFSAEIKAALVAELENCTEYQMALAFKDYILQTITDPGVQRVIAYTFPEPVNVGVMQLCLKYLIGHKFDNIFNVIENVSTMTITLDMMEFL